MSERSIIHTLGDPYKTNHLEGSTVRQPIMCKMRPFQSRFVQGATAPEVDTAALSLPRGNGKSWLAAHLLTRCLTPGDPLHVPGSEYLLCAASIEQARLCYRFIRADLEPVGGIGSLTARRGSESQGRATQSCGYCPATARRQWASWGVRCSWPTNPARGKRAAAS